MRIKLIVFHIFATVACLIPGVFAADVRPLVVAHRGMLLDAPENTIVNFESCLKLGIGFELDVMRSKDGHLVCIHDSTVDRTTNGKGRVDSLTLQELQKLDAGSWFDAQFAGQRVPTIDEVFAVIARSGRRDVLIAVDLKAADERVEADTVKLANLYGILDRLLFIGRTIASDDVRDRLRAADARTHTARVANNPGEFPASLAATNADWVYVRYLPDAASVKRVHDAGKRVFIAGATVAGNQPKNWQTVSDAGVDAILTDYSLGLSRMIRAGLQSR